MKIAAIAALFPPMVIGGAEVSASNLAVRLAKRGHDVSVLSTTTQTADKQIGREVYGDLVNVRRQPMPRRYTAYNFSNHSQIAKAIWHGQDHFDWRNRRIWADFLDEVEPDLALVQVAQGLGYNGLAELGKRDIPTIFVLHDLSLACYKTSMFANDETCEGQCRACNLSSRAKYRYVSRIPRIGFVSPSLSNYRTVSKYVPIGDRPYRVILNANGYDVAQVEKKESPRLRLVYAGQISRSKGVEFLLNVIGQVAKQHDVSLLVVGGGPELERLRSTYAGEDWVRFTGKVDQSEVSALMMESDILCAPSLWPDNSPGVIIQAMTGGLPVLGSDRGGIPELVEHDVTGAVIEAGNEAAWIETISDLCADKSKLKAWSDATLAAADRFDPEGSVSKYLAFAQEIMATPAPHGRT